MFLYAILLNNTKAAHVDWESTRLWQPRQDGTSGDHHSLPTPASARSRLSRLRTFTGQSLVRVSRVAGVRFELTASRL